MKPTRKFLLTANGRDSIGLARTIVDLPGISIVSSTGQRFDDRFVLTAEVQVNERLVDAFEDSVDRLRETLFVHAVPLDGDGATTSAQTIDGVTSLTVASFEAERIVFDVSDVIAEAGYSIDRFGGSRLSSAFSGASLFVLRFALRGEDEEALRTGLDEFCQRRSGEYSLDANGIPLRPLAREEAVQSGNVFSFDPSLN